MLFSRWRDSLLWLATTVFAVAGFWWAARSPQPPPQPGRTVITWYLPINAMRDHYEAQVAAFEKLHPEIKVRILWVPGTEYNSKLKTLAAVGQLPDLFYTGDIWLSYFLPFTRDITEFVQRDAVEFGLDDYLPEIRRAMQLNGRYYIATQDMNLSLLYYNRRMFVQAGLPEPTAEWTWADYVRAGQALTREGGNGSPPVWGSSRILGWWGEWLIFVRQAGGKVFTPDGRGCLLDSPEAIAGLRFYLEKSTKNHFSAPAGYEPVNAFVNERVAMVFGGHTVYWSNYNQNPDLDWDVQVLPAGPARRIGGELAMAGYSISRTSPHPEAAWALAKFVTRREAVAEVVARGCISVRRSVADAVLHAPGRRPNPRNLEAVYRQFEFGEPMQHHPNFIEIVTQLVQPEVDRMLLGEQTPEETGRRAAAAANAFLATFKSEAAP